MKHLSYYLDYVNNATKVAKYAGFINAQGSGIVHYATGAGYMVGSVWYAADAGKSLSSICPRLLSSKSNAASFKCAGGSVRSPKTQTSGLAGLNAAAKARYDFLKV